MIKMATKILIADDHKLFREGLKNVIEKNVSLKVIAEATEGREAIKLCSQLHPDVVIMDVSMPGLNGIEATRSIVKDYPHIKVIALSMHPDKQFITKMLKAGAYAYLQKDSEVSELINAIKIVSQDQKYISHNVSNIIIDEFLNGSAEEKSQLSHREKEILQLIAEGKSSREIAEILFLSSKTVDAHRKNIMDKLNLYTIPELTKYAIKSGLTSLEN
jgi:DNA-binding NarL/FixJ family response regulator